MQLPNESSDRGDTNSAEFSVAHALALNLEAVFNHTMNNALGRGKGRECGGEDERRCGGRGGKVREKYNEIDPGRVYI